MLQPYPANWTLITPVLYLPITTTNFSKMASYIYPRVDSLQISRENALLRPVVQDLNSAINQINQYPAYEY